MIHKFCLTALVIALAAPVPALAMETHALGKVPVYDVADKRGKVLATLEHDQLVELRRCHDGWCLISFPLDGGWVRQEVLVLRGGGA
jgi:SH3-like domain-containing protein